MPCFDSTGPEGRGAYGRGLGPCGEGRGYYPRGLFGFRRGRRWGGRGFWPFHRLVVETQANLKAEKSWLEEQLEVINRRLSELEEK